MEPYFSRGEIIKYDENIFNNVMDKIKEDASIHEYLNNSKHYCYVMVDVNTENLIYLVLS